MRDVHLRKTTERLYLPELLGKKMPSNSTSNMFFYTYVLQSPVTLFTRVTGQSLKDDNYYVGYTNNLRKRIEEHNSGKNMSTKPRTPFKLIYFEGCLNENDAKQREKYLKNTIGRRYLGRRLKHYRQFLPR